MGASNSTVVDEDKALQLCRERKKLIGQALDSRCALAATHISYIDALKLTGTVLRAFVEFEAPSAHASNSATPEALVLNRKFASGIQQSALSFSHGNGNVSPSPSPPSIRSYQVNHMKFGGIFSRKIEEKASLPHTVSVSSVTPQSTTPRSTEKPELPPFGSNDQQPGTPPFDSINKQPETPPWDYFGLFDKVDNQFSTPEQLELKKGSKFAEELNHFGEEGTSQLEGGDAELSSPGREESLESDEFDEPVTPTLVRSFQNVNRDGGNISDLASKHTVASEAKSPYRAENDSPVLTPLRGATSPATPLSEVKTTAKEGDEEENVAPKDFVSSMKDIEYLFGKASESGREVPRMLEANKFHFRPINPGNEGGSLSASFLSSCFSCGDDPSQVPEEPPETNVKYLTWHRTSSSRCSSSRNLIGSNPAEEMEDLTKNLLDSLSMVSRSHASTLDRLFAWEKKLYDEVKASQMIRRLYDKKCKFLRQQESNEENPEKINRTRAVVKDLHSRVRVAIHRINSVSKKIEELRDTELQPQLEELIEGLLKMWVMMLDCHKLQFHIISVAYAPPTVKIFLQSDSHRQITLHLQNELSSLSSRFTKWIGAQKTYIEAIDKWLLKCVSLPEKSSKRKRRIPPPSIRNLGPPIYVTCGLWMEKFQSLPTKSVVDSIKTLAAEITTFLPHLEKNQGKGMNHAYSPLEQTVTGTGLRDVAADDTMLGLDHFRIGLAGFLGQLDKFAESSVQMFTELQEAIEDAKNSYNHVMS